MHNFVPLNKVYNDHKVLIKKKAINKSINSLDWKDFFFQPKLLL